MQAYPSGLRSQSAKLIFVGSNPTACSTLICVLSRKKEEEENEGPRTSYLEVPYRCR